MSGFVVMSRDAIDHPLLRDGERFRAWFWMVATACWKPTRVKIKGETVLLDRGELTFSQRFLAEKWGWSKSRVDRFIAELRDEGMIATRSKNGAVSDHKAGQGQSIIAICNYAKYQDVSDSDWGNSGASTGATAGQQRGKEEPLNHRTTLEADASNSVLRVDPFPKPDWCSSQVWLDLKANRKAKRLPCTATAHAKLLRDLDKLSDDEWPPGRLLEAIVGLGWAAAYDPRQQSPRASRTGTGNGNGGTNASHDHRDGYARSLDRRLGLDRDGEPARPAG